MKKYAIRCIYTILFVVGLIYIYHMFDFVISNDVESLTRVTMHDFYEIDVIDDVFIGSSHSIRSIDANALSDRLDRSVFNLSSAAQDYITGYYLVKEALDSHKEIKHVYYEVNFTMLAEERAPDLGVYIISDYMRGRINRFQLIRDEFSVQQYISSFCRLKRNIGPTDFWAIGKMDSVYSKKKESNYLNYEGTEQYRGRGQWCENGTEDSGITAINTESTNLLNYSINDIEAGELDYLRRIIRECQKRNVEITLYFTPYSEYYLKYFDDCNKVMGLINNIADEEGIDVINMALVKDEYMSFDSSEFYDLDHIYVSSCDKVTDFLCEYINHPSQHYFCANVNEKYPDVDDVKAVAYTREFVTESGEVVSKAKGGETEYIKVNISALANDNVPVNVRVWSTTQEVYNIPGTLVDEVVGNHIDEYSVEFYIPFDEYKTWYTVQLLDADNDEILYDATTRFDMD